MENKIIYIGNILSKQGITPTTIEILGPRLEKRYNITYASPYWNSIIRILHMTYVFIQNLKTSSVVLIDTYSSLAFWYTIIIALLAQLFNKPYIPILHGGKLPRRLLSNPKFCRIIFSKSFLNVAPSNYLNHHFNEAGFKTILVPNFIDISNYIFQKRSKIKPGLLWVRAFHQQYNPEMAVKVTAALAPAFPDIQLCMVGPDKDGSMEQCKQLAVDLGVADRIVFSGLLSKAEWIALSANYDIFINTTNIDNTPVSVIEAMALGLPVVSTDAGGMPFLIEDGIDGRLVPQGDTEAFAAAITHLLEHPDLALQLSQKARQKVEQYDWEVVKSQWFDVIDKAIESSKKNKA